jgi:hypothetical protein
VSYDDRECVPGCLRASRCRSSAATQAGRRGRSARHGGGCSQATSAGTSWAATALTDRIVLTLPEGDADLLAHRDWIAREVLADEIDLRADLKEPAIVKAEPAHTPP